MPTKFGITIFAHKNCFGELLVKKQFLYLFLCLYIIMGPLPLWKEPRRCHGKETRTHTIYEVQHGDTLSEIALRYGISVEQIRLWNRLRGDKIIKGQSLKLWPHSSPKWYVVRSGDTLSEIAIQFGISISSLRQLNNISRDRIYTGQKLMLSQYRSTDEEALTHVIKEGDTLWDIGKLYGISIARLKELNHLSGDIIIPGKTLKITKPRKEGTFPEEQFEYIVKEGDSLSEIAHKYDVGINLLRQLNHLQGDLIYPGQKLQLRPSSLDEAVHIVRRGETLSDIALKYGLNLDELREINDIEDSKILVGQKLRLKTTPTATHIVERGDALWEIARAYGMTVEDLKRLNGLEKDIIYPGQELQLNAGQSKQFDIYTVREGDYIERIARLHQMSVKELKKLNNLRSSIIHPGDELKVDPLLGWGSDWSKVREIDWNDLMNSSRGVRRIQSENGPYYGWSPQAAHQSHDRYFEVAHQSPLQTYKQAKRLFRAFEREVTRIERLSNTLNGWHIVLDPGHGGLDPGAVVETLDGNGKKVYIVEDEYVYDIALRVYVLLCLHGAEVEMTLLSPNHLTRHSNPPTRTFVNEKNEVYNSYSLNKRNRWKNWPSGGRDGNLSNRVRIAQKAFKGVPKNRRIFLSFHADIDPTAPEAPLVLYYKSRNSHREDLASRQFAKALLPALGAAAHARGQPLAVLRNNPAMVKVVLELRNLAYTDHAWALRFEQLRQRDAEKVVKGVLDYVRQQISRAGHTVSSFPKYSALLNIEMKE